MSTRGSSSSVTASGFAVLLLAVSAGVGSGELGLLAGLVGILVGASLIAIGAQMADEDPASFGALTAFLRRNLAVIGLVLASSAVTAVLGEPGPVLCCGMFALLLLGLSLTTIGILGE